MTRSHRREAEEFLGLRGQYTSQGCKRRQETDYRAAGSSPLDFVRHDDSQNPYHHLSAPPRLLGNRWRHTYEVSLNPTVPGLVVLQRGGQRD